MLLNIFVVVATAALQAVQPAPCTSLPTPVAQDTMSVAIGIRLPDAVPGSPARGRTPQPSPIESRHGALLLAALQRVRGALGAAPTLGAPDAGSRFVLADTATKAPRLAADIANALTMTVSRTGEITGIAIDMRSADAALDSALLDAARRASGSSELVSL